MNNKKCCGFCHCGDNTSLGLGELYLFESSIDANTQQSILSNIREQLRLTANSKPNADESLGRLQKSFEKFDNFASKSKSFA
jgi:hypothetical protein